MKKLLDLPIGKRLKTKKYTYRIAISDEACKRAGVECCFIDFPTNSLVCKNCAGTRVYVKYVKINQGW